MVLVFLRDWRSVIVVVLNIPFALLAALVALWLTGQTINLMTLGGLALAVGILVDEGDGRGREHPRPDGAHALHGAGRLARESGDGGAAAAGDALHPGRVHPLVLHGRSRSQAFVPLSLAVGFSMVASYILSSTFVPVMSVWLLRHHHHPEQPLAEDSRFSFGRFRAAYARFLQRVQGIRWYMIGGYVVISVLVILVVGGTRGTEIFPAVDSGFFQMRLRAASGTRIEDTEELIQKALAIVKKEAGPENVDVTVAFGGVSPSSYTINTVYLWTAGPEEVVVRIALKPHSGIRLEDFKEHLRHQLPEQLEPWLRDRLVAQGLNEEQVASRIHGLRLSFEPADMLNEVMSFGSRTPIEVAVSGPKLADSRAHARRIYERLGQIKSLRDLQYVQAFDYPTVEVKVDRERAGESDVTADELGRSLVPSTSSSRFTVPNYWCDPASGVGYQVQVEVPRDRMNSSKEVGMISVKRTPKGSVMIRDVADVGEGMMPGEYDRYNMRRIVSMTANVEGEDLGGVANRIDDAIRAAGDPPRGVTVAVRGQIVPMRQMFAGLGRGLAMAVVVIFLLLAAYFQSFRLAFIVTTTVPAVLAGVVLALWATRTTINIQSFMGAIMAVGVAVANAILLVTFAERSRSSGSERGRRRGPGGPGASAADLDDEHGDDRGHGADGAGAGRRRATNRPPGPGRHRRPARRHLRNTDLVASRFHGRAEKSQPCLGIDGPLRSGERALCSGRENRSPRRRSHRSLRGVAAENGTVLQRSGSVNSIAKHLLRFGLKCLPLIGMAGAALTSAGCTGTSPASGQAKEPESVVAKAGPPKKQSLAHIVEQPGRIEAYEQAPLFAKISGYVDKVNVDIGASVHKGQVLAELSMPETVKEVQQKKAAVAQAKVEIDQAEKAVKTAKASDATAQSLIEEAKFTLVRAQADLDRWQSQYTRMEKLARTKVIDEQSRDEALLQMKAAEATIELDKAKIQSAEANKRESEARLEKAIADVGAARSKHRFAEADLARMKAWLEYAQIRAPFDGVVSDRHVDPGHFLQPGVSGGARKAEPLFIVVRRDKVRVFVDVPETDAICIKDGSSTAQIRIQALNEAEFEGKITGSSWSLDPGQRTLRTEIDLENPDGRLRPGMYAYAHIHVVRPEVWTLPASAVVARDSQMFCFCVEEGKAVRTPIRIGFREKGVVELLKKQSISPSGEKRWQDFTGQEAIVQVDAANLSDGQPVKTEK